MKTSGRIIRLILILVLSTLCFEAWAEGEGEGEKKKERKKTRTVIRHFVLNTGDRPQPQSVEPVVGESDLSEGYLDLQFTADLGTVVITVTNSYGNVVDQHAMNTDIVKGAVLNLPDPDDTYELVIEGGQYLGLGTIF